MSTKLSRQELIRIAELLISDEVSDHGEASRLLQLFEDSVPYPNGADLIMFYRHEFRNAAELVDFALGQEIARKLSREELIAVVDKLMTADVSNDIESQRLGRLFNANVPHPGGTDLIFYPAKEFKSAQELVDYALSYRGKPT
jgi:hypothetical protein